MDNNTLIASMEFARNRLLGTLDTIEKSGQDSREVLAWRPGPGRAHIGWQAMHLAATHDKYINVNFLNREVSDPELVRNFGWGSKVSDDNVPSLALIREALDRHYAVFKNFMEGVKPEDFARTHPAGPGKTRTLGEGVLQMIWHETHHQGQIHITWNLYKGAHGIA